MIQLIVLLAVLTLGGIVAYICLKEEMEARHVARKYRHETKRLELIEELTKTLRRTN